VNHTGVTVRSDRSEWSTDRQIAGSALPEVAGGDRTAELGIAG